MSAAPSRAVQAKLTRLAADYARDQLGANAPTADIAACSAYLRRLPEQQRGTIVGGDLGWLVICGDRFDNFRGQERQPQQSSDLADE